MRYTCVDDIHDPDQKYLIIPGFLPTSSSSGLWDATTVPQPATSMTAAWFGLLAGVAVALVEEVFSAAGSGKPNLPKENVIRQIENLPEHPDFYESDEAPPDRATKDAAKQTLLGFSPSGLLAGADVYGYYGDIHINWETQRRKLRLVIPANGSNRQPSLYHGWMRDGRVMESRTEPEVSHKDLRTWLEWLQG